MGALLKRLWSDPAYFAASIRGAIQMLGVMAASGMLPTGKLGWYLGWVAIAAGGFIPAGNKTPPLLDRIQSLSPQEHEQVIGELLKPQAPRGKGEGK